MMSAPNQHDRAFAALAGLHRTPSDIADAAAARPARLEIAGDLAFAAGRVHEVCGPARRMLALWAMAALPPDAPVLWLLPKWERDRICPQGLADWTCPSGLIVLNCPRERDLLACAEDCLRSGAAALVVVELSVPPALTPVRRLHLAAQEGRARAIATMRRQPRRAQNGATVDRDGHAIGLGLILTPEAGGAQGVESRWHMAPSPAPAQARTALDGPHPFWHLQRLRARMSPPAAWQVHLDLGSRRDDGEADYSRDAQIMNKPDDIPPATSLPLALTPLPQD